MVSFCWLYFIFVFLKPEDSLLVCLSLYVSLPIKFTLTLE